jgi:hypothetical protein
VQKKNGRSAMNVRHGSILGSALGALTLVAVAADFPSHKPGLWEMTIGVSQTGTPPVTERMCLDAATDQLILKMAGGINQRMCSRTDLHSAGGKVVVDTTCHVGTSTVTGHSVTTFVGNTSTHTETTMHYDPPMRGKSDGSSTQDGKWIGACPADMKPGDMLISNPSLPQPIRMNINDMLKGAQGAQ